MADSPALGNVAAPLGGPLFARENQLIQRAGSGKSTNATIEKSAKEFESILLGSWLQQAEQSFGSLPGGDDDADADVGKEQFQGIAMQSLGTSMTASGGIGIARMIAKQLHKSEEGRVADSGKLNKAG